MNISIYLTKLAILLCDNSPLKKNLGCGYCMVREMEVAGWCQQRFPKYDENKEHSELIVYFPDLAWTCSSTLSTNHLVYNKIWSALWKKGKPSMDCGSLSFWVWCESASVSWTQIAGMPPWFQRWPRHTGRCLHGFCSIVGMPPTGRNGWSHQLGFIIFIHHRFAGHHTRRCLLLLIGFPSFSMGSCQRYGLFMPVDVFVFSRFYTTNGNLPLRLARECSSCRLYHADYIYIIFL